MGNVLTLFYTAVGLVIFGNRFRNIQEIAKCYDKSKFNLETRSRDAIKDIMDLGFSYWESVLAIGVGMKIININDFKTTKRNRYGEYYRKIVVYFQKT